MKRGDVLFVDLTPAHSGEADKLRPCIVVSNDGVNGITARNERGVVTVVPVTQIRQSTPAPFHVLIDDAVVLRLMGLTKPSKAQAEQVCAVSYDRIARSVGHAPPHVMADVDAALRFHLSL